MARTFTYPPPTPVTELHIRAARFADLPMIQEIHNQGIADRVATLDTEPRTMADTQLWFSRHDPRHPVLVGGLSPISEIRFGEGSSWPLPKSGALGLRPHDRQTYQGGDRR